MSPPTFNCRRDTLGMEGVITFDIDRTAGTARVIGNNGASDVVPAYAIDAVSFIEITPAGYIVLTTVFAERPKAEALTERGNLLERRQLLSQPVEFVGVMSRHLSFFGTTAISQLSGWCWRLE